MKWQIEVSTAIFFILKTHRCKISIFPLLLPHRSLRASSKYNCEINALVDEVEGISEVRKRFYKVMLQQRYEKILMYAYRQL